MEVSGIISSRPSLFSGVLSSRRTSSSMFVPSPPSGFSDTGHLQFYCSGLKLKAVSTRCGGGGAVKENDSASKKNMKMLKKRLKLLKGLSKDITFLSEMEIVSNSNFQQVQDQDQDDHSSMDIIDGRKLSEATELLMGQLKQLKAAEKEVKMNKKKEKAKLKAARKQNLLLGCEDSSSSSSSESSGDEHPRQVMDMSRLKKALAEGRSLNTELQSPPHEIGCLPENKINLISSSSSSLMEAIAPAKIETDLQPETKMIEVCMGSKCKKLGAAALMEEFQKSVGVEIAVVGCKCMGKCRSAPNVKVHDVEQRLLVSSAAEQEEGEEIEKRNRSPLLCTGVGLNDVSLIVSNI